MTATLEQTAINLWQYVTPDALALKERQAMKDAANAYALNVGKPRVERAVRAITGTPVTFDRAEVTSIESANEYQQDCFIELRLGENLWMRARACYRADGTSWIETPWLRAICLNCGEAINADGGDADNLGRLYAALDYCECRGGVDVAVAA